LGLAWVKENVLSDYNIEIVNCRFIKPMDLAYLEKIKEKFSSIITIEEGTKIVGFGDGVASWLLENDYKGNFKKIGLPDNFVEHGSRNQILEMLGLDAKGIANQLQNFLNKKKVK
jgi:1-deoxy-D-xylulose-5-phosphate synthase